MKVLRIVGVYNASGGLRGELAYIAGKLLGTAHCALCDISHDALREKDEFRRCRRGLPVPLEMLHLDEQDDALKSFTRRRAPCVVGITSQGPVLLLDAAALKRCDGSVERFEQALREALDPAR